MKHYANTCRKEIRELFPKGEDGTTVINGTIFVNEKGEPNTAQASLFGQVLQDLQDYDSEIGSFKYIKKEFKTRLYESFLRQNAGIRFLGQYFTPRNVVQAIVAMSDAAQLKKGARICDPFCGVGGFLLELISENKQIWKEFEPKDGKVAPEIAVVGYDKGSDEKEDERTIILAKANMLIYFSDLLVKYHTKAHLKAFSEGAFNKVFHLIRSNLGTFGKTDDEAYDLILTNPPYVTSGSSSLKRSIDEGGLSTRYVSGGRGTEALAMEWIISNLKNSGQAIIVVPDGLLNQSTMLAYIQSRCIIQGIVSLPTRTFYSTPKKTYILAIRKKDDETENQETPVFTYLVSEIGETRDANRWNNAKNDLIELVHLFNQFKGAPLYFKSTSERCKVVSFDDFGGKPNWMVDRWWSKEERISLGVEDESTEINSSDFSQMIKDAGSVISNILDDELSNIDYDGSVSFEKVNISDEESFSLQIGERIYKKDQLDSGVPAYSANVNKPFGFIETSNLDDFSKPSLIWGIDGIFDWGYIPENVEFATTDHCGRLIVTNQDLYPKYVYYALKNTKEQYGFDRTYRASLKNISQAVSVEVPVNKIGDFDWNAQVAIADRYEKLEAAKTKILEQLEMLSSAQIVLGGS